MKNKEQLIVLLRSRTSTHDIYYLDHEVNWAETFCDSVIWDSSDLDYLLSYLAKDSAKYDYDYMITTLDSDELIYSSLGSEVI